MDIKEEFEALNGKDKLGWYECLPCGRVKNIYNPKGNGESNCLKCNSVMTPILCKNKIIELSKQFKIQYDERG